MLIPDLTKCIISSIDWSGETGSLKVMEMGDFGLQLVAPSILAGSIGTLFLFASIATPSLSGVSCS